MALHDDRRDTVAPGPSTHILLVEDNADQRELTIEALSEAIHGAQVMTAKEGPCALEMLHRDHSQVDVAILDYNLPGMTGLELLRQIKRARPGTPVIMVTGQGDETIAVDAMKNGAHDYIIKTRNYHEALPIAIERAIRENRMKRELEEASLRGRRLYEISLSAAKERNVDVLSECLVNGAAKLIGAQRSLLYLVNADGSIAFLKSFGIDAEQTALMNSLEEIGLLSSPYTENRPVVVEQPQAHGRWESTPWLHPILRQMLAVPLTLQGRVEGGLCVINKSNHQPFSPEDVDTLSTLAVHAGVAIDNARFVEKIKQQAITDSLTGLYNHMEFQKQLTKEVYRSRRYENKFSLLMIDLDHFKHINDTYGHQVGDMVLKRIGRILRDHLRAIDKVFRYGGEEFAMILPETEREGAWAISERLRQAIADTAHRIAFGQSLNVTVSIGVSSFPQDAREREDVIRTADQALFSAKRSGRNRVAVYGEVAGAIEAYRRAELEDELWDPRMKTLRDLTAATDPQPCRNSRAEAAVKYARRLADLLPLDDDDKTCLQFACLLQYAGVGDAPNDPADPQGSLDRQARRALHSRPPPAQTLIKYTEQLAAALQAVLYRHERYDGRGYPDGLKGEAIPYLARVLSVVAAYNEMTSLRSPALSKAQGIGELKKNAGTLFDPGIVASFIAMLGQ